MWSDPNKLFTCRATLVLLFSGVLVMLRCLSIITYEDNSLKKTRTSTINNIAILGFVVCLAMYTVFKRNTCA